MILLVALQLALPLILIVWIAVAPARSVLGFCIQAVAIALVLLAIGLAGVWTFPPWWAPYGFACLLAFAIVMGTFRRWPFASMRPSRPGEWTLAISLIAVAVLAGHQSVRAVGGRAPQSRVLELAFPLEKGTYLVVNGGSDPSVNAHMKTLDTSVPRFRVWRGQSYGVDIVGIDRFGRRADGIQPSAPSAYRIYGARVLAPCGGKVVAVVGHLPDMQVPEVDRLNMAGNHATIRCGDTIVLLGHFRPGSHAVTAGSTVEVGDVIAAVGNSGNSDEPHLHIHAQEPGTVNEPFSGDPTAVRLNGRFLVRGDRVTVP